MTKILIIIVVLTQKKLFYLISGIYFYDGCIFVMLAFLIFEETKMKFEAILLIIL